MKSRISLEKIIKNIWLFFDVNPGIRSAILGISGGIDSALIAALIDISAYPNLKLIGRSLPIKTNESEEIRRSFLVGKAFCNDFKLVDQNELDKLHSVFERVIEKEESFSEADLGERIQKGNIAARIRMIYSYLYQSNLKIIRKLMKWDQTFNG